MYLVDFFATERKKKQKPETINTWVNGFMEDVIKHKMVLSVQVAQKKISYDFMKYAPKHANIKDWDDYKKCFITNAKKDGTNHLEFCMQAAEFILESQKIRIL